MADDKIFVRGMIFKTPPEGAPEWLKGKVSIRVEEFVQWLEENMGEREWVNLDIKESKSGKLYGQLNTFKREG